MLKSRPWLTFTCLLICLLGYSVRASGAVRRVHPSQGAATNTSPLVIVGPTDVVVGQTASYTATAAGGSLQWSVNGVPGGNATVGTIQSTGVFHAPGAMPVGGTVTLTCSNGGGRSASKVVSIVKLLVIKGPTAILLSETAPFVATSSNGALQWRVNNVVGGNATVGTMTSNGVYQAPATMVQGATVTISCSDASGQTAYQAVELLSPSKAGGAQPAPIAIIGPSLVALGDSALFTANPTGLNLQWRVNNVIGGNATAGTITGSGVYQAPPTMVPGAAVTISCSDASGQTAYQKVTLLRPLILAGPNSVVLGQSALFKAAPGGSVMQWSVDGAVGGNTSVGFIQPGGQYQAPAIMPQQGAVIISGTDSNGQTASLVVQLLSPLTITGPNTVILGQSALFTVTPAQSSLKWSANGITGGNAVSGYIANNGAYQAPGNMPAQGVVTISCIAADGVTSSLTVALQEASPTITQAQLTQSNIVSYLLTVTGSGFNSTSVLLVNGNAIPIKSVSSTLITGRVVASALQSPAATVQVNNPAPGGGASNAVQLTTGLPTSAATITAASRLLDQATFGPTMSDIQHVQSVGLQAYLDEQFNEPPSLIPPMPSYANLADCRPFYQCFSDGWWFRHAMWGGDQLRQKVAFALSEQWVVSYVQVNPTYFPALLNIFTNDAFGNWRTLMQDVTLSGAMGIFLDMVNSQKPGIGQQADQNYAREVMQLFDLGLDRLNQDATLQYDNSGNLIPVYSPDQIDAFARAFTGWTYGSTSFNQPCAPATRLVNWYPNTLPGANCPMTPVESMHDTSLKILLDGAVLPPGQSAEDDLNQALDNIFNDPNLPPFVSKQLIQHLVTSMPSPAYVERVADVFVNDGSGVRGNLKAVITATLLDPEARADDISGQVSANDGKIREPLLWMISLLRALNGKNIAPTTLRQFGGILGVAGGMGEQIHDSADVFGYFSPYYMIPGTTINAPEFELESSYSFPLEQNFAEQVVGGYLNQEVHTDCSATGLLGQLAAGDPAYLVEYLNIVMMHGKMPNEMRSAILTAIQGTGDPARMVRMAVFLVSTSPQYKVMD